MRLAAVFPQVHALPRPQRRLAAMHRHAQAHAGQDRPHVGRHVVRPFGIVLEQRIAIAHRRARTNVPVSRTAGSAFSQISSEQLVCRVNMLAMPVCTWLAAIASATLLLMSQKPRPRVCTTKPFWATCGAGWAWLTGTAAGWSRSARDGSSARARAAGTRAVPELDYVRFHHEATPVRRARHVAALVFLLAARHALLEGVAVRQRLRLQRGPGADLAARARDWRNRRRTLPPCSLRAAPSTRTCTP